MLEHFHAGDDVKLTRRRSCEGLRIGQPIVDLEVLSRRVQTRNLDHARRKINTGDVRTGAREGFAQKTAAAADIEHSGTGEARALGHEARAHRVQQMQRTKLALRIPEARRERIEFIKLRAIRVRRGPAS